MVTKAKEFYEETVRRLSPKERLRLAVMILNDFQSSEKQIDFNDSWSDEDLQDLTTFTLSHGANPHDQTEKEKPRNR